MKLILNKNSIFVGDLVAIQPPFKQIIIINQKNYEVLNFRKSHWGLEKNSAVIRKRQAKIES